MAPPNSNLNLEKVFIGTDSGFDVSTKETYGTRPHPNEVIAENHLYAQVQIVHSLFFESWYLSYKKYWEEYPVRCTKENLTFHFGGIP